MLTEQIGGLDELADTVLITADGLLVGDFLEAQQSEGVYLASPELAPAAEVSDATGRTADDVLDVLEASHGTPATPYWTFAYDATALLLHAIERVAEVDGGNLVIDRAELRDELMSTAGFQGIVGELNCDDFGDCGTGNVSIFHHTDSRITDPTELELVYDFTPGVQEDE